MRVVRRGIMGVPRRTIIKPTGESTMELYHHTVELRVGAAVVASVAIAAEILHDDYTDGEWTVGEIQAEALRPVIGPDGADDYAEVMVRVPEDSQLYNILLCDLLNTCTDDIEEKWALYLLDARETGRCNYAERKLDAAATGEF